MIQRSLLLFQNSLKSKESVKSYTWALEKFLEFYKVSDCDSLIILPKDKLQIMLEDYVINIKQRISPNSVPTYYFPIQSFLEANEIDLRWKKIKKLFPAKIKPSGAQAYSTEDIQKMLSVTSQSRNKAIIHFEASTGCRVGAIPELQLRHLIEMPMGCYTITVYEGTLEEYVAFLTPEASKSLNEYLDKRRADGEFLKPSNPLFRAKYVLGVQPAKPISAKGTHNVVYRSCLKAGLRAPDSKQNGRFEKMLDHGFRKRFNTILKLNKDIPVAVTERLLGHVVYRDENGTMVKHDRSYMRADVEQLFEYFKLAIYDLTINDTERLRVKNENLSKTMTESEKSHKVIMENYEAKLAEATDMLERATSALKIMDHQKSLDDLAEVAPHHFTENKQILQKEIDRLKKTIQ